MFQSFVTEPTPNQVAAKGMQALGPSPRQRQAIRAWRYYDQTAYSPAYARQFPHPYTEWDEVKNGPRPLLQPLPKRIVEIGAQFLFSEAPRFLAGDPESDPNPLQEMLDDVVNMNLLNSRWLSEARAAGIEGATVFKFAWTPNNRRRPVSVQTLSPFDVHFFRDALDADVITMARIQFKFFDESDGNWYLYREEWTDQFQTVYRKLKTREEDDTEAVKNLRGEWPIEKELPNPFGLIPLTLIYNKRVKGDTEGYGDFWDLFDKFDQYNHKMWLEHRSDQLDSDRIAVIINDPSFDSAIKPGMGISLVGEGADAKWLEAGNNLRPDLRQSKQDLRKNIFDAAGMDDLDVATITNKGNLTRAVFEMTYANTLKSTYEKREFWGPCGLEVFWQNMLCGLSMLADARLRFPGLKQVRIEDYASHRVETQWPDLFRVTPEERTATIDDLVTSVDNGFLTRARAVDQSCKVWGIKDVGVLQGELAKQHEQLEAADQAALDAAVNEAENAGKPPAAV